MNFPEKTMSSSISNLKDLNTKMGKKLDSFQEFTPQAFGVDMKLPTGIQKPFENGSIH
jgi:hypothetical protein